MNPDKEDPCCNPSSLLDGKMIRPVGKDIQIPKCLQPQSSMDTASLSLQNTEPKKPGLKRYILYDFLPADFLELIKTHLLQ